MSCFMLPGMCSTHDAIGFAVAKPYFMCCQRQTNAICPGHEKDVRYLLWLPSSHSSQRWSAPTASATDAKPSLARQLASSILSLGTIAGPWYAKEE